MQIEKPCVVEQATLTTTGEGDAFEAALTRGLRVLAKADGFQWVQVLRQIEDPTVYVLLVGWDDVASHTEGFVGSELFAQWRAEIGAFLAGPATVAHHDVLRA